MNNDGLTCAAVTWAVSLLGGVIAAALLMVLGGWSFMQGLFVGLLVFVIGGAFLSWTMCRPLPKPGSVHLGHSVAAPAKPAAVPAPAPTPAPAPVATAPAPASAAEVPAGGTKPATLSAAREGGPDDLKRIKGVGPKMEAMLHSMGFFHFDQIASWTAAEVAWVHENLEGFKGRVSRDNWVEQARLLASGGETEFSKRVDKGGVY